VLPTLVSRPAADVSSSSSSSTTTASGSDNVTFDARTTQQIHDSSNNNSNNNNDNNNWQQQQQTKKQTNFIPLKDPFAPTPEEREAERLARRERARERQAKVAEAMKKVRPPPEQMQRVSDEELEVLRRDHPEFRELWGSGSSKSKNLIQYADPGQDYDMWSQAYRMLGGFIDCDHQKSQGSGDHNEEGGGNNNAGNNQACSRWMMWAAVSFFTHSHTHNCTVPYHPILRATSFAIVRHNIPETQLLLTFILSLMLLPLLLAPVRRPELPRIRVQRVFW
jgi:hypothetical protein